MKLVIAAEVSWKGATCLYSPLTCDHKVWEWYDGDEFPGVAPENLPHDLFLLLTGGDPEKFVATYDTFEAAMDALRDTLAKREMS